MLVTSDSPFAISGYNRFLPRIRCRSGNRIAREYLLCFDLLRYDLDEFIEDYRPDMIPGHVYHEAVLIWLSLHDRLNEEQVVRYGVDVSTVDRMNRFSQNPERYKNTYWYYYLLALNEQ